MRSQNRIGGTRRRTWQRNAPASPTTTTRNSPTVEPLREPVATPHGDPVVDALRDILADERESANRDVLAALEQLRQPVRPPNLPLPGDQPTATPRGDEPDPRFGRFGFGDLSDMQDMLYGGLGQPQRKVRNQRSDAGMQAWIIANRNNDREQMRRIGRELDAEFRRAGGERAGYLYGTPNATSGIGASGGGELVPLPLAALIVMARDRESVGRSLFQRFTSNANTLRVPTSGVATAAMVAEAATAAQVNPTPASVLLSKKKAQAKFRTSDEMLEDSAFNLVSFFSDRAGSALGALEDVQFATSNGTAPNVTTSLVTGVTDVAEATSTVLTYKDLVKLFFALPKAYRRDALFAADGTTLQLLSTLIDANGRPILAPGMQQATVVEDTVPGQVGTVFGRPIVDLPFTSGSLWVGSPKLAYGYLDGGPINVRTSEHVAWATDEVEWKITERFDGAVMLADAARKMLALATVA